MRRLAWSVIPGGMGLAAASFVGGSWYLAGKIRSEALAVGPGPAMPAYDDARVAGLSPGRVRLRAAGDQPALFRPMLCGIAWPGGTGYLGAAASVSGGVVTRSLTVVHGLLAASPARWLLIFDNARDRAAVANQQPDRRTAALRAHPAESQFGAGAVQR